MKKIKINISEGIKFPHPYILKARILEIPANIEKGAEVVVINKQGKIVGTGFYNPDTYKAIRIHTYGEAKFLDYREIEKRIKKAFKKRKEFFDEEESFRLIFSESDLLTGLIIDKIGKGFVIQINSAGMETKRELIVKVLKEIFEPEFIYEKSDSFARKEEGLENFKKLLFGNFKNPYEIFTEGLYFLVDIENGQKTGFFLDQKSNRLDMAKYAEGKICLDLFSYTGAFTIHFLKNGAEKVFAIDISEKALKLLKENLRINNLDERKLTIIEGDVFEKLREIKQWKIEFDLIINDPPSFTHKKRKKENALKGYKNLHSEIFDILNRKGILATFSCTHAIGIEDLIETIYGVQKNRDFVIEIKKFLFQSPCHPMVLYFPESFYLKGVVLSRD